MRRDVDALGFHCPPHDGFESGIEEQNFSSSVHGDVDMIFSAKAG
jgi:hypothetical protein